MFDSILNLLWDAPQAYLIVLALAIGDAVLPVLPSETAVILAGILCTTGPKLTLGWVIAAAAVGAWIGDNTSYVLGRYAGEPMRRRFFDGDKSTRTLAWARRQLDTPRRRDHRRLPLRPRRSHGDDVRLRTDSRRAATVR